MNEKQNSPSEEPAQAVPAKIRKLSETMFEVSIARAGNEYGWSAIPLDYVGITHLESDRWYASYIDARVAWIRFADENDLDYFFE